MNRDLFQLLPIPLDTRRRLVFRGRQDLQCLRPRPHHNAGRLSGRRHPAVAKDCSRGKRAVHGLSLTCRTAFQIFSMAMSKF